MKKNLFRVLLALALTISFGSVSGVALNNHSTTVTKQQTKGIVVYGTRTGHKYHRDGCRYLRRSKIRMTLAEAKASGLTPCSVCNPPR